ncbi:TetR/AcrR family transcriptional regulator [Streptomyces fuscigenes]|uniref:TetR/AcrR family transcriptional regulator n=1 Tax=Streptomyces fuscigenes TaxID=1528880 RepID=UPI001F39680E|nr:TetR/AcrR family transcriptional regulator [Streptomyces fuscigenes]MCF3962670.1 TetR/AcrR family transcriptional regulator [Streptomyces fuscigenes]
MKTATRPGTEAEAHRVTRPRADALRNRERIVSAAREMFVEFGPEAPLDEIARRAGIGNATLYRHFPDRSALLVEVVRSVMSRAVESAERVSAEEPDPFVALCRYVHEAADERIGALCTLLSGDFKPHRADLDVERLRLTEAVEAMMERARQAGRLRQDVGHGDLMVALAQLSRPLPGTGCMDIDRFTHRHLQLFLDGLEAPARSALPGRSATLEDLRRANP